jgi:hypothetical protein
MAARRANDGLISIFNDSMVDKGIRKVWGRPDASASSSGRASAIALSAKDRAASDRREIDVSRRGSALE